MHTQFAKVALALIDQVRGPYDDQNIQAVIGTKNFLRQIVAGHLLVVAPPKLEPAPEQPK